MVGACGPRPWDGVACLCFQSMDFDKDGIAAAIADVSRRLRLLNAESLPRAERAVHLAKMHRQLQTKLRQCQRAIQCHPAGRVGNRPYQVLLDGLAYHIAVIEGMNDFDASINPTLTAHNRRQSRRLSGVQRMSRHMGYLNMQPEAEATLDDAQRAAVVRRLIPPLPLENLKVTDLEEEDAEEEPIDAGTETDGVPTLRRVSCCDAPEGVPQRRRVSFCEGAGDAPEGGPQRRRVSFCEGAGDAPEGGPQRRRVSPYEAAGDAPEGGPQRRRVSPYEGAGDAPEGGPQRRRVSCVETQAQGPTEDLSETVPGVAQDATADSAPGAASHISLLHRRLLALKTRVDVRKEVDMLKEANEELSVIPDPASLGLTAAVVSAEPASPVSSSSVGPSDSPLSPSAKTISFSASPTGSLPASPLDLPGSPGNSPKTSLFQKQLPARSTPRTDSSLSNGMGLEEFGCSTWQAAQDDPIDDENAGSDDGLTHDISDDGFTHDIRRRKSTLRVNVQSSILDQIISSMMPDTVDRANSFQAAARRRWASGFVRKRSESLSPKQTTFPNVQATEHRTVPAERATSAPEPAPGASSPADPALSPARRGVSPTERALSFNKRPPSDRRPSASAAAAPIIQPLRASLDWPTTLRNADAAKLPPSSFPKRMSTVADPSLTLGVQPAGRRPRPLRLQLP